MKDKLLPQANNQGALPTPLHHLSAVRVWENANHFETKPKRETADTEMKIPQSISALPDSH